MMCRHGFAATLYSRLQTEVEMHVIRAAQTLRDALDQVSNEENVLLKEIHALWQRFREQLVCRIRGTSFVERITYFPCRC